MKRGLFIFVLMQLAFTSYGQTEKEQLTIETRTGITTIHTTDLKKKSVQRQLLKEYFLCECFRECYKDSHNIQKDLSPSVYFDIMSYELEAFRKVDEYARKTVASIGPSPMVDLNNSKCYFIILMDFYKSKELDRFIKQMDKYLYKSKWPIT